MASSFMRFLDHTHHDAPQSVGLLWMGDQLVAETCPWQNTALTRDRHLCKRREFLFKHLLHFQTYT